MGDDFDLLMSLRDLHDGACDGTLMISNCNDFYFLIWRWGWIMARIVNLILFFFCCIRITEWILHFINSFIGNFQSRSNHSKVWNWVDIECGVCRRVATASQFEHHFEKLHVFALSWLKVFLQELNRFYNLISCRVLHPFIRQLCRQRTSYHDEQMTSHSWLDILRPANSSNKQHSLHYYHRSSLNRHNESSSINSFINYN